MSHLIETNTSEDYRPAYYGLPQEVKFCKRCVISNQRPSSVVEFKNTGTDTKPTVHFDDDGICAACRYYDMKKEFDWNEREYQLRQLCDRYRSRNGSYDIVVPGSGGKDSTFASHVLKYKYGMNPITVTWAPHKYTDIGRKNFDNWIETGLDNFLQTPNAKVHRLLTRLAFENLCHPFQPFIIGQRMIGPRFSAMMKIPLIMYGEHAAEYGDNIQGALKPTMDSAFYSLKPNLDELFLGGVSARELIAKHNVRTADLNPYLPIDGDLLREEGTEVHHLGYYINWDPQENYYYAVNNCNFETNTERTQGSFSKYSSFDDKMDQLHYYTTIIKFGIGRATYDAAQECRTGKITREEAVILVRRFDTEFPSQNFHEMLDYMEINEDKFWEVIDKARSPHLWKKTGNDWALRHQVT